MNTTPQEETLFQAALPLAAAERAAFLDRECAGDRALRARLEALLAADAQPDTAFGTESGAARPTISLDLAHDLADDLVGRTIGRYKLLEKIGEGGCGVVYVAEQTEPVRRRVALKIIKLGMDTKQVVARFEAERQALAMMDHPNIAKVLDAGTTEGGKSEVRSPKSEGRPKSEVRSLEPPPCPSNFEVRPSPFTSDFELRTSDFPLPRGRPYFVMELVRGIKITDYCDQEQLSTRDRLDLFIKVCHAIQHAHQKGIIHRDIKPSNILVTLHDGVPVPKVIDFGIAKATEGRLTDATVYTHLHQFIGTPAYMSPEQAEMTSLDIDTRSDIYSLGVLLYELLTGVTPFDAKELMSQGIDSMRRTIREQEPVRPSTRLTQLRQQEQAQSPTANRHGRAAQAKAKSDIRNHKSEIETDLDWIVMKCLEKDRGRRYETANGLAADLQRHLNDEPVVARPPSAGYRLQKAFRRHKLVFAAGSAVALALLAGLGLTLWQAGMARWERDRALRAEALARDESAERRRHTYAAEVNLAFQALDDHGLDRARALLDRQRPRPGEDDLRGFEWRHLWQSCRGTEIQTLGGGAGGPVAGSPDGRFVAHGSPRVTLRDARSREVIGTLPVQATAIAFSPDSRLLAVSHDGGVGVWSTENLEQVRTLPPGLDPVLFSPDGRWLLTGLQGGYRVWDTATWQPLGDCGGAPFVRILARNATAFSPDSRFLVTAAGGNWPGGDHLRVWRLPDLIRLQDLRPKVAEPAAVAFNLDGTRLLAGLWDGQVLVWEFPTGRVITEQRLHRTAIWAMALAPDGQAVATAGLDRTIGLWNPITFAPLTRLRGHVGEIFSLGFLGEGSELASGSLDGTVKLWNTATGSASAIDDGPCLVAGFMGDGRRLVAFEPEALTIRDPIAEQRTRFAIPPRRMPLAQGIWGRPVAVKPDAPLVVLGDWDGMVEVWELTTGLNVATWSAHQEDVTDITFSADGAWLATGNGAGEVKVWDFAQRRELMRFAPRGVGGAASVQGDPDDTRYVFELAFSPDRAVLAAACMSQGIWLFRLDSKEAVQLPNVGQQAQAVAISPNGTLLAGSSANVVQVWNLDSLRVVTELRGHLSSVKAVAFAPDSRTLATAGYDRQLILWDAALGLQVASIAIAAPVPTLDFSPDSRMLVVGDLTAIGRGVRVLQAPTLEEIAAVEWTR